MARKVLVFAVIFVLGFALGMAFLAHRGSFPPHVTRAPAGAAAGEVPAPPVKDFAAIAKAVTPAVVNISTVRTGEASSRGAEPFEDYFDGLFGPWAESGKTGTVMEHGLGSGLVISPDGYILTSSHVVMGAEKIKVTLYDRRVFKGVLIGADPKTDLAVVKISADALPTVPWGDSDALSVGEFALAVGNPFGLSHTVTMGIVSAVGRANVGIADYEDFIQTDAAINPGNSGGPLVDTTGNLIGVNTALFSRSGGYQGIGFAVPSNMARSIAEQLIERGRVVRGWLGIGIQELTPELARKFGAKAPEGALVSDFLPGSPAEAAGLSNGDIVLRFGGVRVDGPAELRNLVARSTPGAKVSVEILRDGRRHEMSVTVGETPREAERPAGAPPGERKHDVFSGLRVIALTGDVARQLNVPSGRGAVVAGVREGSPAAEAGLRRGDVILEVEQRRIQGPADFRALSVASRPGAAVMLYINRGGRKFYVTVAAS
jgi:serine protease Do